MNKRKITKSPTQILFVCIGIVFACNPSDPKDLHGDDYRLFKNTPVWNLAKAVAEENVNEIQRCITEQKQDINYREPKYGSTLLMLSILNDDYIAFKKLIDFGADVNIHNKYSGTSAIILAAGSGDTSDIRYLRLLLLNGANPNDEEVGERRDGNSTRLTPLIAACQYARDENSPKIKVSLLVEYGAKINYKNEFGQSPIKTALTFEHFDVVLYLLEHGADFKSVISSIDGNEYYLWDELRYHLLPLESSKYRSKMEVVSFLSRNGIDYRMTPIPDYAINQAKKMYPNDWEEYLKKY